MAGRERRRPSPQSPHPSREGAPLADLRVEEAGGRSMAIGWQAVEDIPRRSEFHGQQTSACVKEEKICGLPKAPHPKEAWRVSRTTNIRGWPKAPYP